jgi:endonuclease YncB( thermonuclease family)
MLLAAIAAGASFTCTPARVWDGDSFTCSDGTKVRVAGIAAREVKWVQGRVIDGGCSEGHPCPSTSGIAARDALAGLFGGTRGTGPHGHLLVRGSLLQCVSNGSAGRGRVGAWCSSEASGDVSCRMVKGGYALRWDKHWRGHACR